MNRNINLELNERVEDVREQQEQRHVVHFNLREIKDRFDESVQSIEEKFGVYDELIVSDKESDAKDILRSQIFF